VCGLASKVYKNAATAGGSPGQAPRFATWQQATSLADQLKGSESMRRIRWIIITGVMLYNGAAQSQEVAEDFRAGALDWSVWCPCQINIEKAPLEFYSDPDELDDFILAIVADDSSLGGNICRQQAPQRECRAPELVLGYTQFTLMDEEGRSGFEEALPEFEEPLGPSFFQRQRPTLFSAPDAEVEDIPAKNPYCTEEVERRAKQAGEENICIQRQELRLQKIYSHEMTDPFVYSLRFRMPATIEDEDNSIRWLIAQWKHEPISKKYLELGDKWGPSPFLAQRFDNGVLHVTVQDEHCRCMIASAPLPDGSRISWEDGPARYCISTRPGDREGQTCTSDLLFEYADDPILPNPQGRWVEMTYRIQAGRNGSGAIDVYAGERLIVQATGSLGYEQLEDEASLVKFKVGVYRDYMPFVHRMELDAFSMQPAPVH
jgi:hypothetical protein